MIKRYPHTATISIESVIDNGTAFPDTNITEVDVKGRYEPNGGNKSLDYSAKFFCKEKLSLLNDDPYALDGQKMAFGGRDIGIVKAWNYQTHTEIWLD